MTINQQWCEKLTKSNNNNLDHPDCNIVKISLNTQKSSGDMKILSLTQTPVKDNLSMLM